MDPRVAGVHVALGRSVVLVTLQLLRDYRIAGVLDVVRHELVADGVPRQALRSTVIEPRELKQRAPHALEGLDGLP